MRSSAHLHTVRNERRRSVRGDYNALVSVRVHDGPAKGTPYLGLLRDISDGAIGVVLDGAIGVVLDGAYLARGTAVTVEMDGLPSRSAQVCHSMRLIHRTLIGFSFAAVANEAASWQTALDGVVATENNAG
jgi:hypothetical protein